MTPAQYIAAAPVEKRADLKTLDALIKRVAPTFEPYVESERMLGYGKYSYRYASGHEGSSCRVGVASNKGGFSLYVCAADANGWLAEQDKDALGKAKVGKSCIVFKQLADLNLPALETLIKKAHGMKAPGETDPSNDATKTAAKKKPAAKKKAAKPKKTKAAAKRKK